MMPVTAVIRVTAREGVSGRTKTSISPENASR